MDQQSGIGWTPIGGQAGAAASIGAVVSGVATITGLTGMTPASVLHLLTLTGCASPGNNATCQIVAYVSATSVQIANSAAVAADANNGSISWTENTVSLQNPDTVGIPDDGDAWDAAEFAPGYEGLAQRTAFESYHRKVLKAVSFASSGTWVAPPGVNWVIFEGCGGGGGGEQGCVGSTSTTSFSAQGGGGAGAPYGRVTQQVVPGELYTVTIGAGGAGGTGGGGAGADGGSTVFSGSFLVDTIFLGGRGCGIGVDVVAAGFGDLVVQPGGSGTGVMVAPGAQGVDSIAGRPWPYVNAAINVMHYYPGDHTATVLDNQRYETEMPGSGGACIAAANITSTTLDNFSSASLQGKPCEVSIGSPGTSGGAPGAQGGNVAGPYYGGPGGGGGGGGPYGAGGAGGAGGLAKTSGTGHAGTAGGAAADNSGAGGGGGGVGGGAPDTGGPGGAGGPGGSGQLTLYFVADNTFTKGVVTP